jgi:hypothetical protein
MAATNQDGTTIPQKKKAELLGLIKGADSVELKLVVPMDAHRTAIQGIGLDPVEAEPRQVFFFDTRNLDLNKAGVIVRARRIHGGGGDTVVKLRPVDPATIDKRLRRSNDFKVEVDAVPGGFVCSGSFKGSCTAKEVLAAVSGRTRISSLFSKEQRAFYKEHAPAEIKMDSLLALGPTFLLRARVEPKKLDRRLTFEMWLYPDGSRNLEVSAKCDPDEAFEVAAELRTFLRASGLEIVGGQQTKTAAAMKFFKAQLQPKE